MDSLKIVVIGAGGLGVSSCWGLCQNFLLDRSLELHIYDSDSVELSNLNRQVLFTPADIGKYKSDVLAERLPRLTQSGRVSIHSHPIHLDQLNIEQTLQSASLVIDACDSIRTKFIVNDYCVTQNIPFIYAGAIGEQAQLMTIISQPMSPCLRCLFGDFSNLEIEQHTNSCRADGVFGSIVGQIGFLQAKEAILLISASADQSSSQSQLLRIDLNNPIPRSSLVKVEATCSMGCGSPATKKLDIRDKKCPDTFLYTKLALEQLNCGETLDLRLGSSESLNNVLTSVVEDGHSVRTDAREIADGFWRIILAKQSRETKNAS